MRKKYLSFSTFDDRIFIITGMAIAASFLLTLISFIQLCLTACVGVHHFRLLGLHFEILGFIFFASLGVMHVLSRVYISLSWIVEMLFAGALGAEILFILVQKNQIGTWCPICLTIAFCIFIGAVSLGIRRIKNIRELTIKGQKEEIMKSIWKGITSITAVFVGFLIAFLGVVKHDPLEAAQQSIKESLAFGKKDSPIEAYLFTDWACQACRNLEPSVEPISREVMKEGKMIFVDHVIQPETLNFVPYHLAFMLNDKPQYFKLREMLTNLSSTTSSPSDQEVSVAAAKLGVQYRKLNYSDISLGIKYFKKLGEKFKIKGTPTMVIINIDEKKGKKLTGNHEITQENVSKAIETLKN